MGAERMADGARADTPRLRLVDDYDAESGQVRGRWQPRANVFVRVARISAGATVTAVGIALLVLPGPGLVTVVAGLSILAVDVPAARRIHRRVRARLPSDVDGAIPRWLLVVMGAAAALGVSASAVLAIV